MTCIHVHTGTAIPGVRPEDLTYLVASASTTAVLLLPSCYDATAVRSALLFTSNALAAAGIIFTSAVHDIYILQASIERLAAEHAAAQYFLLSSSEFAPKSEDGLH